MSAGPTVLVVLGVLLVLAGVAFIALDTLGRGDYSSGIDPKDAGTLGVGILLAAIGGVLGRRKPTPAPPPAS